MRILVVEDDEIFCAFLAEILQSNGYHVDCSTDTLDGYQKARCCLYDLIILDVRMPGPSGTEIAAWLKQTKPDTKIILISAFADPSLCETAFNLQTSLLSKPFSPADLFEAIEKATGEQA